MALTSELRRYLVEHLAGRQSFIGEQVVFAIRSSGEISSSEQLTDQQLIDHFPRLFLDLVEYFLSEADPSTRKRTIEAALKHGMTRWQQGYELVEVIRELGIVHRSILEHGIEKFFEENSQSVNSINDARRYMGDFFEDSAAGSVQRYVENFTEQLRSANTELLKANESLSRIDESRLRLIRTVSHELANVLNTLKLTITLVTTGNDEAIRSEMLGICQRNVQEMSELLNDLKDYSVLIAGAASLQIEEINVRVFGSELEASFPCNDAGCRHASRFADRSRSERCTQRSKKDSADHYKPGNKRNKLLPERQTQYDGCARVPIAGSGFLADRCRRFRQRDSL